MEQLFFWQVVGAVFVGNCLFGLSVFMIWRHSRFEDGSIPKRPGPGLYFAGLLGPLCGMVAMWFIL